MRQLANAIIMAFFGLSVLLIPANLHAQTSDPDPETYYRVQIPFSTTAEFDGITSLEIAVDHAHIEGQSIYAELSGYELQMLLDAGFTYDVLVEDVVSWYEDMFVNDPILTGQVAFTPSPDTPENFNLGSFAGHLTLEEVEEELDLMHELFPELITEKFSIGTSIEGRDIWSVWMGTGDFDEKPQAYFNSLIHAREPNSMTALIYTMWWLLENYGEDEMATFLLENRAMAFSPVLNPDGYEYNRQTNPNGGGMHRKNMRDTGGSNPGIDLNRNFGPENFWDHPNGGSSTFPNSDTYRGTEPFSEPETQAIRDFVNANDFRTAFNYHTFSNLLVYPYGALQRETPESHIFRGYAEEMTEYNDYVYGTDMETVGYNTRGGADDWMYGQPINYDEDRSRIISMTPEVGSWSDYFWPPVHRIETLSAENLHPNILLALYAGPELREEWSGPPVAGLEKLEIGKENSLYFEFEGVYNYGRTSISGATITITTDSEYAEIIVGEVSLDDVKPDAELTWVPEPFVIEIDPWTSTQVEIPVTLTLQAPFMKQAYEFEYTFTTEGSPLSNEEGDDIPTIAELHQNYPNPFNPTTQIRYDLPEAGTVRLDVYDVTGRRVAELVNEHQNAGANQVNFDGSSLSSGIYLYRLSFGNVTLTRKMMLVK